MAKKDKNNLKLFLVVDLAVVIVGVLAAAKYSGGSASDEDIPTFVVERGPLTISVDASGTCYAGRCHYGPRALRWPH